jgi:hypothetical protein
MLSRPAHPVLTRESVGVIDFELDSRVAGN